MNKKLWIARLILTLLSVLAVSAIFYNSSLDAVTSTTQSDPLVDGINAFFKSIGLPITVDDFIVRKAAHFSEYGVLGVLLSVTVYLYAQKRWKSFFITLPIGAGVAVCDELIQMFPAGRSCEVRDMLIDFSGVLCAALIMQLILYLIERHKRKKEGNELERTHSE